MLLVSRCQQLFLTESSMQVAGTEQRNARLANAELANGSDNRVVTHFMRYKLEVYHVRSEPKPYNKYTETAQLYI